MGTRRGIGGTVGVALALGALVLLAAGCGLGRRQAPATVNAPPAVTSAAPTPGRFTATAYTVEGTTASGHQTRAWTCAADPDVLPLGTRIRVRGAGRHSGEYVVRDTGRKIVGRKIDLYIADDAEAKRFGRREVSVEVLR